MFKQNNIQKKGTNSLIAIGVVFFAVVVNPFSSAEPLKENKLIEQRDTFFKAEKLLYKTGSSKYKKLYAELNEYPLQPYLKQQQLIDNLSLKNEDEIDAFLKKYRTSPLDWRLRKLWLRYLVKKDEAELFLKYYKSSSDVALNCQRLIYQLEQNYSLKRVLEQTTDLWTVGKSQSDTCDPLFKLWEEAGYRTDDVILKRIELAADGGKHTLIPYLTKLLPSNKQYLGSLWHKVRRDPVNITKQSNFPNKTPKEADVMTYGLKRLIWRNPELAIKTFKKVQISTAFTPKQKSEITTAFAISLSSKNHKQANYWLERVEAESLTEDLIQWRITNALKDRNWNNVITTLEGLPKAFQDNIQWQYWHARALIESGEPEAGTKILGEVAEQRHYYGFLAASHLNKPVNLQNRPIVITDKEKNSILEHGATRRAFELYRINRPLKARSEWNHLLTQLTEREKMVVSVLAYENSWFDRAIFTLAEVGYFDDVMLRFPKGYQEEISEYANKQKISPAWAFAITRRESSFMPDASSSAGAKGLMQVLPSTAKMLKRKSLSNDYLFDADNNIKLGTQYLKKLLDKSKGNQVLATASYNAGPYRVKKWLKHIKEIPADIWIETIPYKETRNYVKSVLAYQEIYQHKPNQVSYLFEKLINMKIGK